MVLPRYFVPVKTKPVPEVRAMLESSDGADFNLVDVRQEREHKKFSLPGSIHIPLKDLLSRAGTLNPKKPVITYCRSGRRSNAAAALLETLGFREVYNMPGGIIEWNGHEADDGPQAGLSVLSGEMDLAQMAAFAWALEDGTGKFYEAIADWMAAPDIVALFTGLAENENAQKNRLAALCEYHIGGDPGENAHAIACGADGPHIEGGLRLADALDWAEGRSIVSLLSFAMAVETNSHNLYVKMARKIEPRECRELFEKMAKEEWEQLEKISPVLDKYL